MAYLLCTAGLGLFWVANQQLPVFDWHYLFGIPGKTAAAVRRFGLSAVDKLPPLKDWFMAEARGESGDVPKLLQGLTI